MPVALNFFLKSLLVSLISLEDVFCSSLVKELQGCLEWLREGSSSTRQDQSTRHPPAAAAGPL